MLKVILNHVLTTLCTSCNTYKFYTRGLNLNLLIFVFLRGGVRCHKHRRGVENQGVYIFVC